MKKRIQNLAGITAKYVDQPFEKHTCMGLLYDIFTELGAKDLPVSFNDLTLDNYMEAFKKDPKATQQEMVKFFINFGQKTSVQYPKIGDILVIWQRTRKCLFPAIYVGRLQGLTSFLKDGVTLFKIDRLNKPVLARRIL